VGRRPRPRCVLSAPLLPGEPVRCTCKQVAVATLEETLTCPAGWIGIKGLGWFHAMPAGRFA
jgi:hypothetical protein